MAASASAERERAGLLGAPCRPSAGTVPRWRSAPDARRSREHAGDRSSYTTPRSGNGRAPDALRDRRRQAPTRTFK